MNQLGTDLVLVCSSVHPAALGGIDRMAQDFHDLSGQMLSKVAALASELEEGLLQLLRGAAPVGPQDGTAPSPGERARSQREVDELLARHGI